jgi:hypothetical protein
MPVLIDTKGKPARSTRRCRVGTVNTGPGGAAKPISCGGPTTAGIDNASSLPPMSLSSALWTRP